jgi:hypothetical protein
MTLASLAAAVSRPNLGNERRSPKCRDAAGANICSRRRGIPASWRMSISAPYLSANRASRKLPVRPHMVQASRIQTLS